MSTTKFNIEKFNGKNDLNIWQLKMKALLIHQVLVEALIGVPATVIEEKKMEIMEKAHNALILSLGDKPLREVTKEKTFATISLKLENLYMTKALANRLYLKQRLYTFKTQTKKSTEEHTDEFNKIIIDIKNIDVNMEDEDKTLLLVCSLPNLYENLSDTLVYGKHSLSLE